jgi:hypothetical protein
MKCLCGVNLRVQETGRQKTDTLWCKACGELYDYSCWLVQTLAEKRRYVHRVEAFPRGVTQRGLDKSPRCEECDACQEWLLAPQTSPVCTRMKRAKIPIAAETMEAVPEEKHR